MEFGLMKFLNNKYLADVNIKVDDTSFKAHKVVIAAASQYFFRTFENETKNEVNLPPYIEPKFGNVSVKTVFQDLLCFFYADQDPEKILPKINEETANVFLALGYSMGIPNLLELSAEFIIDHLLCGRNCVDYLAEGIKFYCQTLIDASMNQVIHNFQEVLKDSNQLQSFNSLPFNIILKIFSSDELSVDLEKTVFDAVLAFISLEPSKVKETEILQLLQEVRWPFLSHNELLAAANNSRLSMCKDLILEGISVQLSEHKIAKDYEYKVIKKPRTSYSIQQKKPQNLETPIRFISKTTTSWKNNLKVQNSETFLHPPQNFSKTFLRPRQEFVYSFDMDENGLFFFLGTSGKQRNWENPVVGEKVLTFCSSVSSGKVEELAGRELNGFRTKNEINSFVGVDLGEGKMLRVTAYTLKNGNSTSNTMICWNFQASNNGSDWVSLDRRNNRQAQDLKYLREKGKTSTWGVALQERGYRFFRILMTDKNLADNHMLSLSCFELYGLALGQEWVFE
jgi:hypothetical protein